MRGVLTLIMPQTEQYFIKATEAINEARLTIRKKPLVKEGAGGEKEIVMKCTILFSL